MYKRGSRANWDLGHRKYVKGIINVKDYVKQQNQRVEQRLQGIKESDWEYEDEGNEDWETPGGDTPTMGGGGVTATPGGGSTRGGGGSNNNTRGGGTTRGGP